MPGEYPEPTEHELVLRNSELFTQVEPDYIADHGSVTYVSRRRGVVVKVDRTAFHNPAQLFVDDGRSGNYASHGWYDPDELRNWLVPVMSSDKAWTYFIRERHADLILPLDMVR